jgi:hypothetical protein
VKKNFPKNISLFQFWPIKGKAIPMTEFIRFDIVEIDSHVWFMYGRQRCSGFKIISFLIIPSYQSGFPVISEVPLPEIFMH